MNLKTLAPIGLLCLASTAFGQHLWWKPAPSEKKATCIYGEIEVLATNKTIYYCGCNWWPGNPAGGYTGIQDPGGGRHNMIFSIWDTSPTLHPTITETETRTQGNRFGGEGTGAHTHLDYDWKIGETYRYYAVKVQDADMKNTLTKLYFYDSGLRKWVHEATISNPNDGHESVTTFGGGLNAFLENWSGEEKTVPKLALYRLWIGTTPSDMVNVTSGVGDGSWGVLNGSFFLAQGDGYQVDSVIRGVQKGPEAVSGKPDRRSRLTVPERKIPSSTIRALKALNP